MAKKKKTESTASLRDYAILERPVITEKAAAEGMIVLKVDSRATKTEIKKAAERIFNVGVEAVRTVNVLGKPKRTARSVGRRASFKKAYITLKAGETVDLLEGI